MINIQNTLTKSIPAQVIYGRAGTNLIHYLMMPTFG